MKVFFINAVVLLLLLVLVDGFAYLTGIKHHYFPTQKGWGLYPQGYFIAHPERGHDIAPSHERVAFDFGDRSVEIFGNDVGCMDEDNADDIRNGYIYLAGDSVTWGYNDYETKFGTALQRQLNRQVLNCGVSHTGQYHQLSKLKELMTGGRLPVPELVVLTMVRNDNLDDKLYPRTNVVDGWLLNQAELGPDGEVVRHSYEQLLTKLEFAQMPVKKMLKEYSLSLNVVKRLYGQLFLKKPPIGLNKGGFGEALALQQFRQYVETLGAELLVVFYDNHPDHFLEMETLLAAQGVETLTIARDPSWQVGTMVWPIDKNHPNQLGNQKMAEIIGRKITAMSRQATLGTEQGL